VSFLGFRGGEYPSAGPGIALGYYTTTLILISLM
jgi:hypothetical protein